MIKLYQLLNEIVGKPKAIILAGAPGAGKGFILRGLELGGMKVLNVDNQYIDNLKQANVTLDLKNATPEERSKAAIAMADANKQFKSSVEQTIKAKEPFILDGTAASLNKTRELKNELVNVGYEVFMLYVYTDLERSLKQNQDRFEKSGGKDRSLAPAIVLRTWASVTSNFKPYEAMFKDNFVSVANTLEDEKLSDVAAIIKKYLVPFKPTGTKPKTDAQKARSEKSKAELNAKVKELLADDNVNMIINNSVSKEEAQAKIKQFLS